VVKCERKRDRLFKIPRVSRVFTNKNAGASVNTEDYLVTARKGFSTEDILWAVGIWSTILCLSPVIAFYMLMVA
jgi:hypothetical protein